MHMCVFLSVMQHINNINTFQTFTKTAHNLPKATTTIYITIRVFWIYIYTSRPINNQHFIINIMIWFILLFYISTDAYFLDIIIHMYLYIYIALLLMYFWCYQMIMWLSIYVYPVHIYWTLARSRSIIFQRRTSQLYFPLVISYAIAMRAIQSL